MSVNKMVLIPHEIHELFTTNLSTLSCELQFTSVHYF